MSIKSIADRMKDYEMRSSSYLTPRSYIIVRVDGCNFKKYTSKLNRPYDDGLIEDMNNTAIEVSAFIYGCKLGFVQSDEISFIIHQPSSITEPWYNYNVQKMVSIIASKTSTVFNKLRRVRNGDDSAIFDARVFVLPTLDEVINYLIWRQIDGKRNSISAAALSLFSHHKLEGKNSQDKIDMMRSVGFDWYHDIDFRRQTGALISKVTYMVDIPTQYLKQDGITQVERSHWGIINTPVFFSKNEICTVDNKNFLSNLLK
jgi:tRNA(His) 5'-end guanylyltransferase